MKQFFVILIITLLCGSALGKEVKVTLRGSEAARAEAFEKANTDERNLEFVSSEERIAELVAEGKLVPLVSEENFIVAEMKKGHPYVLPETLTLLRQESRFLVDNCREKVIVNSALRLTDSDVSSIDNTVHPTGMALDLKNKHLSRTCKDWLRARFLYLEDQGVIQATEEEVHPHFHIAVYREYENYVAENPDSDGALYQVRSGDTLSAIAKRFRTPLTILITSNGLDSPHFLRVGQEIRLR